jgi:hypothetical protein
MRAWALMPVAAACGRIGFADMPPFMANDAAPQMCQVEGWTIPVADPDLELAVTAMPGGASVAWVARAGGDLMGVNIDGSWQLAATPATVKNTYPYVLSALTYLDGSLIYGTNDGNAVKIEVVPPDLSNVPASANEVACPLMTAHVSDVPALHAGAGYISPITSDTGVQFMPFSSSWAQGTVQLTVPSSAPTDITATSVGTTALVAWSTVNGCYVEHVLDAATGSGASANMPCLAPRLAAGTSDVALVYESLGGIAMAVAAPDALDPATATVVVPSGASPRVAFDGARYWIAYRDGLGDIKVGYLADDGAVPTVGVVSNALDRAYELVVIDAQPWLFAMDTTGLEATRFCGL